MLCGFVSSTGQLYCQPQSTFPNSRSKIDPFQGWDKGKRLSRMYVTSLLNMSLTLSLSPPLSLSLPFSFSPFLFLSFSLSLPSPPRPLSPLSYFSLLSLSSLSLSFPAAKLTAGIVFPRTARTRAPRSSRLRPQPRAVRRWIATAMAGGACLPCRSLP